MATKYWTGAGGSHNWESPGNWSGKVAPAPGDTVILDHSTVTAPYLVYLNTAVTLGALSIGSSGNKVGISLQLLAPTSSLTTSGAISFLQPSATIGGQGVISALGGFKLSGSASATIAAGTSTNGGVLDLTGAIDSNILVGFANATVATTLKLESTSTLNNWIAIKFATQTLEIGSTANVTIIAAENITNGAIKLDGGTLSLTSPYGLNVGAGARVSGTGTVSGSVIGSGTITASGGTLTLTGPVSYSVSSAATHLVIADGSSLFLTSATSIGSTRVAPVLTFQGTGDLFQAINAGMSNFYVGAISGFAGTDLMKFASFGAGDTLAYVPGASTITIYNAAHKQSKVFTFDSSATASHVKLTQTTINNAVVDVLSICFLAGTLIATPDGAVPVETLRRGDLVLTSEGAAKPVSWLGKQTISRYFADPLRSWPIRILADALADNAPTRDLLVSPDHALLVDGVLVHAGALVNDLSILRESSVPASFVYYHVELDDHSLILAENVPAETFIDNVDRLHFDNWAEHETLYPQGKPIVEMSYPRAKAWRQVPVAVRDRLARRARLIGERAVA